MKIKYKQSDGSSLNKFHYQFNIHNLLNKLNFIIPKKFIIYLMEKNYTDFGVELTNACNANCSFCAYRFMTRRLNITPIKDFKKIINDYNKNGGGDINFTPVVGDPLVDKNIIEKILFSRSKKKIKNIWIYTNGIYFNRFNTREFLLSGISRISISTFFGDAEKYYKYYGVKKYDQVIQNIKNLSKENNKLSKPVKIYLHLRVELPIERWINNDDYKEIEELIGKHNVSWLEDYENWSGFISQNDIPSGCNMVKKQDLDKKNKSPCFEMYRRMQILSDGNVGVCSCKDFDAEINIGNIENNNLNEIWRGNKLKKYRDDWKNNKLPEVCKDCDRYNSIDSYIKSNAFSIIIKNAKRFSRKILNN